MKSIYVLNVTLLGDRISEDDEYFPTLEDALYYMKTEAGQFDDSEGKLKKVRGEYVWYSNIATYRLREENLWTKNP